MKAESTVKPLVPFEILPYETEKVEILFYDNIKPVPKEEIDEAQKYSYDFYRVIVKNREGLKNNIELNIDAWIELAKKNEIKKKIEKITLEQKNRSDIDYISIMMGVDL